MLNIMTSSEPKKVHKFKKSWLFLIFLIFLKTWLGSERTNTFSLKQIAKTENVDAKTIVRQCKLDLMSFFWR